MGNGGGAVLAAPVLCPGEMCMEVLMMVGPYAGEIKDVKPFNARQMIEDGRALDPNAPIIPPPPQPVVVHTVVAVAAKGKGKR